MTTIMKDTIQYILTKDVPDLGAIKLASMLFFIDREIWVVTCKKKFLGVDFKKLKSGLMYDVILPDKDKDFDAQEFDNRIGDQRMAIIDFVIERDRDMTENSIWDMTHDSVRDSLADNEIMSYGSFGCMRADYYLEDNTYILNEKEADLDEIAWREYQQAKEDGTLHLVPISEFYPTFNQEKAPN